MPRKGAVPAREILPDPKYGDVIVHKLINKVMKDGKKSVAEWIVYTALESAAKEVNMEPVELLHKVVEKLKPEFEVFLLQELLPFLALLLTSLCLGLLTGLWPLGTILGP